MLNRFALLIRKRCLVVLKGLSDTILQSRVDQQTQGHHQHQGHDAFRGLQIQRRGHEQGVLEEAKTGLNAVLALVTRQDLGVWEEVGIDIVGGEDKTAR
jgi:hypothetical protein